MKVDKGSVVCGRQSPDKGIFLFSSFFCGRESVDFVELEEQAGKKSGSWKLSRMKEAQEVVDVL